MTELYNSSKANAAGEGILTDVFSWHYNTAYNATRIATQGFVGGFKSPEDLEAYKNSAIADSVFFDAFKSRWHS